MATPLEFDRNRTAADRFANLSDTVRQQSDAITALVAHVAELAERVRVLETTTHTGRPRTDDLSDRVLAWMKEYPGLHVTALIVSESMGEDNVKVGNRMISLASAGKIETEKRDNRTRMYWAAPAAPAAVATGPNPFEGLER